MKNVLAPSLARLRPGRSHIKLRDAKGRQPRGTGRRGAVELSSHSLRDPQGPKDPVGSMRIAFEEN